MSARPPKRPRPDEVYRGATRLFAAIILGFGVAMVVITLARGGGLAATGLWIGLLFVALGAGRLYLALRG
ncbi:MAG TPA: hypothetical protein VIL04_13740 [Solirubrobacterales bacterium]